jgi:hypothetical protein
MRCWCPGDVERRFRPLSWRPDDGDVEGRPVSQRLLMATTRCRNRAGDDVVKLAARRAPRADARSVNRRESSAAPTGLGLDLFVESLLIVVPRPISRRRRSALAPLLLAPNHVDDRHERISPLRRKFEPESP